jgi:hypothetical protein
LPFLPTDDNLIDWSADRPLTWSDFKGTPDRTSPNAALTHSSINVEFGFNEKGMTHTIKCRFNKSLSWGRIKNDYILNHEQGHFDIAEIHARLLHKALLDYSFNAKTVNDDVTKIYNKVVDAHVKLQKSYDAQTNHSIDTAQQNVWDKKIDSLLKVLKPFADYR